jgi:dihydrofolate synthase / folylpolyglutamate synthase
MATCLTEILDRLGGESRIHYSLDHFNQALSACGHPEKSVKTIVIAGTNGKGTVSLLLTHALKEAGYQVGTYLSPHLQSPAERIQHQGIPVALPTLDAIAAQYENVMDQFQLTYFEAMTLIAFVWAAQSNLDYLVLEVGMGGRLDATNVTEPIACVLTTIDWDHMKYLGNTLEAILGEKMGVFRHGVPVWSNVRQAYLMAGLEKQCRALAAPITYGWKVSQQRQSLSWDGQNALIDGHPFSLRNPSPGTLENSALAYSVLRGLFPSLSVSTIQNAFAKVVNPGRMETVATSPRVVLSGDHNPAGIECLVSTLTDLKTRPRIVCGFSPDKPYREMIDRLRSFTDDFTLTQVSRLATQMPPDYSTLAPFDPDPVHAVKAALERCDPDDTLLVTGSLYLVGEVRAIWKSC